MAHAGPSSRATQPFTFGQSGGTTSLTPHPSRSPLPSSRESTGSNNTYVMSGSPRKTSRKRHHEPYMPKIITTVGQRPACLVNASVTYVGNDQIYAFGGFDQYTDEGNYLNAADKCLI